MATLISRGNSKLKKDKIASFGLPACKTCPGAGICKKFCYASKGSYRFPCVVASREANYKATFRADFVDKMIAELCKLSSKIQAVRIHDSGDFYSQEYLDNWVAIIRAVPDLKFYCYTKSFKLDWSEFDATANAARGQSEGSKYDHLIKPNLTRVSIDEKGSDSNDSDLVSMYKMFNKQPIVLKAH